MLFGYAQTAPEDNWVHDCMSAIMREGQNRIVAGGDPEAWPDCIPNLHRAKLEGETKLKDLLDAYWDALRAAEGHHQALVLEAFHTHNRVPDVFLDHGTCTSVSALPDEVRKPLVKVFKQAFGLLTKHGTRDTQYQLVYRDLPDQVCAYCGVSPLEAPGGPRHHLDHLLKISGYPFAGSDLRNLVPMCERCNVSYKGQDDLAHDHRGRRRRSFEPYGNHPEYGGVCLSGSQLFSENGVTPIWNVQLTGPDEEVETWDSVWTISRRYRDDVINPRFLRWLRALARHCSHSGFPTNPTELKQKIDYLIEISEMESRFGIDYFKRKFFEYLKALADEADASERLLRLLKNSTLEPAEVA